MPPRAPAAPPRRPPKRAQEKSNTALIKQRRKWKRKRSRLRSLDQHRFCLFAGRKVGAVGMVEHQRADARLGFRHHALGEAHSDAVGLEEFPKSLLVVQIGACGIAETVALATVTRGEALLHGHGGRVGK